MTQVRKAFGPASLKRLYSVTNGLLTFIYKIDGGQSDI